MLNIAALNEVSKIDSRREKIRLPLHKEACVTAAGPSLDSSAEILARNRDEKFIIAADTAYPALLARGIFPDAVVTIDGQTASARHFLSVRQFSEEKRGGRNVILFADLCCNPAVPRLFYSRGEPVVFVKNRHPLSELARQYALYRGAPQDFLPFVQSGAGTVTVSAASLAFSCGFSSVSFFGADFSFPGGKPYTRGTYLDNFFASSSRVSPGETAFASLMYRRALCYADDGKTPATRLLLSYKKSLEALKNSPRESVPLGFAPPPAGVFDSFAGWYAGQLFMLLFDRAEFDPLASRDSVFLSCLPFLAAQRTAQQKKRSKKEEIFYALKLAYEVTKQYNITQWK
ncbi:MAG: hypothetical protein Pg6C_09230 [Treponemataceae bacterium]|nr:MAG: hypothetical protein Pg6C_09230 [Treponemataceae bacterium]